MKNLAGKNVLVLGLGQSGLALARWCVRSGANVTVADTRAVPPQLESLTSTLPKAIFVTGALDEALFNSAVFDLVLKSPGLSPAACADVVKAAAQRGTAVGNELSLFSSVLTELQTDIAYSPQIIGITGTNGKTTVTALTAQLVKRAGKSVAVAGNIGPTLLDTLSELIDAQQLPDVWVLELSSFQLDGVHTFEPTVATVLNISQDHLDWHDTSAAYASAKANVYGTSARMLLNRNDAQVMTAKPVDDKVCGKPGEKVNGKVRPARQYVTFGTDEPLRAGDYGIQTLSGIAWLVRAAELDESIKPKRGSKPDAAELVIQRLMPVDALRIAGLHNACNALAALALASAVGCPLAQTLHGLREYRGEPHRVQSVAVLGGIEYFDDSKGTNVGATVAALCGLGISRKLVVILGGEGKGQDFSVLRAPVSRYARAAVLIGRDAPLIRTALEGTPATLINAGSMNEAVLIAARQAQPGDAVLLSPACASFDMFDNYEHRAHAFCDAVQAMALDSGVAL